MEEKSHNLVSIFSGQGQTIYFKYPPEIRRIIYTTNMVEGYYRQLRKVTKTQNAYPNDDALRKIIYGDRGELELVRE